MLFRLKARPTCPRCGKSISEIETTITLVLKLRLSGRQLVKLLSGENVDLSRCIRVERVEGDVVRCPHCGHVILKVDLDQLLRK